MLRLEFGDYLGAALAALAREIPPAYAALTRALDGMSVRFDVDGRACSLRCADGVHALGAGLAGCDTEVATDTATILDLVDARCSLVQAVRSDRLHLRGPVAAVARFDRGLGAFLAGAVRGPSFPSLLEDLRLRGAARPEEP